MNYHVHGRLHKENGCRWDERTCEIAARGGRLHVLQLLRENGCGWNGWTYRAAVTHGHLHVLQWMIQNLCPGVDEYEHLLR